MENASGNKEAKPDGIMDESPKCSGCGAALNGADDFCGECGAKVNGDGIAGAGKLWSDEVDASVKKASKWILAVGFMFLVFGTFLGFMQKSTRDTAFANLRQYEDSMTWSAPVNGKTVTVGELKRMVDFEYYSVFGTNYFLAMVMFVIFFWSKRSPFSAFVTALSIYMGVIVLNAVVDPKTLAQGLILKIAVIAALISGIKAAVPTRGLARGRA
ncbi:MAG: zinc ribbon protein [Fibrobacteres bacterium]|nr:zinc ribbon protein [Fibrobacterota bacterium]